MDTKELKQHIVDTYGLHHTQVWADGGGISDLHWLVTLRDKSGDGRAFITWFCGEYKVSIAGGYVRADQAIESAELIDIAGKLLTSGILNSTRPPQE